MTTKPDPRKPILVTEADQPITAAEARRIALANKDESIGRSLFRDVMTQIRHYMTFGSESTYIELKPFQAGCVVQVVEMLTELGFRVDINDKEFWDPGTGATTPRKVGMTVIWAEQEKAGCNVCEETCDACATGPAPINEATCKGSFVLGTACGACSKCDEERRQMLEKKQSECSHARVEHLHVLGRFDQVARCLDCGKWENV